MSDEVFVGIIIIALGIFLFDLMDLFVGFAVFWIVVTSVYLREKVRVEK